MANTSDPYRRLGSNSWEELLDQVNDELQNPPSGCDPLDPIDTPGEDHRWAKSDIREVHDKLDEMPGDCFTFEDVPDLWKISIIEDIEGQLSEAWCDCGEERCCYDCPNCEVGVFETTFLTTETVGPNDCTGCSTTPADSTNCQTIKQGAYTDAVNNWFEISTYAGRQFDWCGLLEELAVLQEELEQLEDELAELQQELVECGTNQACIDAKQQEIDDKQQEVDDKQQEVDDAESDWMDAKLAHEGSCAAMVAALDAMTTSCGDTSLYDLVAGFTMPFPEGLVDACFDPENVDPEGPTPQCCFRSWVACLISWQLDRKTYSTVCTTCGGSPCTPFQGNFIGVMNGWFDIDGTPCPTNFQGSPCPISHLRFYCFSTCCCCSPICGSCCAAHPNNDYNVDYVIRTRVPRCFGEIDCGGGPCGDGEEG